MSLRILCINQGSSSLKYSLYEIGEKESLVLSGETQSIFTLIKEKSLRFDAISHRIVHGGKQHVAPERVDHNLIAKLKEISSFAPLHLPEEIALVETFQTHYPKIPQVLCFDTAFHRKMPPLSQCFPLPKELFEEGVLRYGFHGLSYEYILSTLPKEDQQKLIIAHLGSGASLAAISKGDPLNTTMGLSPMGGVMMGTRPGDLDPGVLLYLEEQKGWDRKELSEILNHQSGLLGVSKISSNLQTLLKHKGEQAEFAIDLFCESVRKAIGAFAASLGGLTTLVFTAGIGENSSRIREKICKNLDFLGIELDQSANEHHKRLISKGACRILVIPTNENLMLARHASQLLKEP